MGANSSQLNKSDCYDIVVDIKAISDVKEGWPIYISPTLEKRVETAKTDKEKLEVLKLDQIFTTVAVLGLFNRGKTFLLNKMNNLNLPSGKRINTKGLSFVQSTTPGKNLILLDTAGTNSPLNRINNDEDESSALAQKKATEMFMQELAFAFADVIIVVVNELTWPDQEYIKTLQVKLERAKKDQKKEYGELFVVHNYSSVTSEIELLEMWRKYVICTHVGQSIQYKDAIYFREQTKVLTHHFFLANDDSPPGKKWNPKTISSLLSFVTTRTPKSKAALHDLFMLHISETLKLYCKNPQNVKIIVNPKHEGTKESDPKTKNEKASGPKTKNEKAFNPPEPPKTMITDTGNVEVTMNEWMKDTILKEENPPGFFIIKAEGDLNLKADKIDFDGFRILLTRGNEDFIPKIDALSHSLGVSITVDVAGFIATNAKGSLEKGGQISHHISRLEDKPPILVIEGERKLYHLVYEEEKPKLENYEPSEANSSKELTRIKVSEIGTNRSMGKFQIEIQLPVNVDEKKRKTVLQDGIYSIFFPIRDEEEIVDFQTGVY